MASKPTIDLNSKCVNYTNVSQGIIHITDDKLKVILLEYKDKNKQFYSWTTPLGIFLSCLLATITADFKNTWLISASTWRAIFILATIGTAVWFIITVIQAFNNRKGRNIDELIDKIKNEQ